MLDREAHHQTVSECLTNDHQRIDALLADLGAMIGDGELERADYALADFTAALRRHIRIEEDVLFPLVESRLAQPIAVMKREHQQILGWHDVLKNSLARLEGAPAATALAELTQRLGLHDMKEEKILYPAIDRIMPADEKRTLLERIAAL